MKAAVVPFLILWCAESIAAQAVPFVVQGKAWVDGGRIMQSSDSALSGPVVDVNDTWLQSAGAQMTVTADLGERWEGAFGFGAYRIAHSLGTIDGIGAPNFLAITMHRSYVTQARLTYHGGERGGAHYAVTVGNFPYHYNANAKNLGAYLLRGPVYPGVLLGGYGDFSLDTTRSNVVGARIHFSHGALRHDVLLMNERELPPTFDWSLAYVAKYHVIDGVEIGGGVSFHRLIPYNRDLLVPGKIDPDDPSKYELGAGGDTLYYSHRGTKLMTMFNADLKRWIGAPMSSNTRELRLYGEAAILGVKDYGDAYGSVRERIPVMLGFNFPTFGVLDLLSVEVEWYGSPHANSLANLGNPAGMVADWTVQDRNIPSPGPVATPDSTKANWKWSVNLEKSIQKHVLLGAQVANDHYRPRPVADGLITAKGGSAAAFTKPEDWYFTFRLGFFF